MIGKNDITPFAACGNYLFYLLYISLITRGGFFPMHGGTSAVYGECPAHGDINASDAICGEPRNITICPPAKEGFFRTLQNHSIRPRHCISLSSEDRNTLIYTLYLLPLLSHRRSSTPPQMGDFYSAKKKKGERRLFRLRLVTRYFPLRFMIILIRLWLNEYRMRNNTHPSKPHSDIAI